MAVSSTAVALGVGSASASVVGLFLLGAISGDVSGLAAVVAGVAGWVRGGVHWGQLRA